MVGNNFRRTVVDGRQQEVEEDDADEEHDQNGDDDAGDARVTLLGVEPGQCVGGELGVDAHGGFWGGGGVGLRVGAVRDEGGCRGSCRGNCRQWGDVRGRGDLRLFLFFFHGLVIGPALI